VKFSPDGKFFALASMDHKIYLYDRETFRLKGTCDRHNSHVTGFDFSRDSVYLQSDSGDYEHLYFEAEDGEYFSSASQLKDIQWADWTCLFGWPVQGEALAVLTIPLLSHALSPSLALSLSSSLSPSLSSLSPSPPPPLSL
jgi:WD40 repeat protein